jgi:hypothetical protein
VTRTAAWLAAAFTVLLVVAAPAHATSCAGFQNELTAAVSGATVTLDPGVCTPSGPGFTVSSKSITIAGAPGAILDGSMLGASQSLLKLTDAGTTTVRDLTLQNATVVADGGAINSSGDGSPTIDRVRFFGNSAGRGGAVSITANTAHTDPIVIRDSVFGSTAAGGPNRGSVGGALYAQGRSIQVVRSSFIGNTATATSNGHGGGGARLEATSSGTTTVSSSTFSDNTALEGGGLSLGCGAKTLTANAFVRNRVSDPTSSNVFEWGGGGVSIFGCFDPVTQVGNLFDRNTVTFGGTPTVSPLGGGEFVSTKAFTSRGDLFLGNQLQVPPSKDAEGAGLALEGCNSANDANHVVSNLVAAGNVFTGAGAGGRDGAGVYIGCSGGPAHVTLLDSTIAGNGGGGTTGLFGGPDDFLTMQNSIVAQNTGGTDLSGFSSKTVTFSDACPLPPGAGNLCSNPLLVSPAAGDVHQTAASPTLDKGSNALVPAGLSTDFEGNPRIQGAAVDIGADERAAPGAAQDSTDPNVTGTAIDKAFAVAKGATPVTGRAAAKRKRKKVKRGTTIRYTLSEAATVRLRIDRALAGRRVTRKRKRVCAKPTRKNRKRRKCTRYKRAGRTLVRTSKAGKNRVKFTGRIARKALKRGRYRLTIVATDAAGNASKARRLNFRIVKP